MLTLHNYWSSVCSQKVRLCLAEKKLPYENRHVNLFEFEHWTPGYLKLNPKAVEIGIVVRGENFRRLEDSEVESYIEKVNAA